ncbi:hypothetical protein HAX54_046703 [Datura stramonium]|uniref:Uncharacterized protein n=1 Tax=Datura stramonium TaxID=4076 RepID=A0ABS8SRX4_DATST|nr:hypothetical protein [Datura stramonium]
MCCYTNNDINKDLRKYLTAPQFKRFSEQTCFTTYTHMPKYHVQAQIIRYVMVREVESSFGDALLISLNGATLHFTQREFTLISGLNCTADDFEFEFDTDVPNMIISQYFGVVKKMPSIQPLCKKSASPKKEAVVTQAIQGEKSFASSGVPQKINVDQNAFLRQEIDLLKKYVKDEFDDIRKLINEKFNSVMDAMRVSHEAEKGFKYQSLGRMPEHAAHVQIHVDDDHIEDLNLLPPNLSFLMNCFQEEVTLLPMQRYRRPGRWNTSPYLSTFESSTGHDVAIKHEIEKYHNFCLSTLQQQISIKRKICFNSLDYAMKKIEVDSMSDDEAPPRKIRPIVNSSRSYRIVFS